MGSIFVIGDIHGTASKLDQLMAKLNINAKEDTLVFLGDYIDRGPDPKRVINTLLEIRKTIVNVICLRGNHEQMFLDYYFENKEEDMFMSNGGITTLISYGFQGSNVKETMRIPESHMDFLMTLKPYYETDHYIFVHAGLRPGIPLERQDVNDLLWLRHEFIHSRYDFGKTVVFGHTPLSYDMPFIKKNKICVDTGAVFGGKLTCIELPNMNIYQV
jgi:serine/threonine protein phosphatase 1